MVKWLCSCKYEEKKEVKNEWNDYTVTVHAWTCKKTGMYIW